MQSQPIVNYETSKNQPVHEPYTGWVCATADDRDNTVSSVIVVMPGRWHSSGAAAQPVR